MRSEIRATKVLVNFATASFFEAQRLNAETGLSVAGFDRAISYSSRDIERDFRIRNRAVLRSRTGAGYWLWKPYFIKRALSLLNEGEFLFYCDSGSHFIARIDPLVEIALRTGQQLLPFELQLLERSYTKRDAFMLMDCDAPPFVDTRQRLAGFILLRKSPFAVSFVDEFFDLAQDPRLITDSRSQLGPDYPDFVAHRHDQSIFSLLTKRHGLTTYRDPSQFGNDLREEYPASTYGQLIDLTRSRTSRPRGLLLSWWKRLRTRPDTAPS
jgi:hypothetical protein